jgi:hypothetical protein
MTGACLLCRIIVGKEPASQVCEDADTMAIVDLRQTNQATCRCCRASCRIARRHAAHRRADADSGARHRTVRRAFIPDGINIWQSNGVTAGRETFHVDVHVFRVGLRTATSASLVGSRAQ